MVYIGTRVCVYVTIDPRDSGSLKNSPVALSMKLRGGAGVVCIIAPGIDCGSGGAKLRRLCIFTGGAYGSSIT